MRKIRFQESRSPYCSHVNLKVSPHNDSMCIYIYTQYIHIYIYGLLIHLPPATWELEMGDLRAPAAPRQKALARAGRLREAYPL